MYNFTSKTSEVNNVNIDLRKEAHSLISEFGFDLLYVRNAKFVKCTCFDDLNKTGKPDCPLCYGSGYFCSIEKCHAFESSNSAYSDTNALLRENTGVTERKNEIYYVEHSKLPKESDWLIKVTWKNGYPVDVVKALQIVSAYEMRGDNGRLEVVGCLVEDRTDKVRDFQAALKSLPPKGAQALLKGGKYIWPHKMLS